MFAALREAAEAFTAPHQPEDGLIATPLADLVFMKCGVQTLPRHVLYKPALCVILSGAKEVTLSDRSLEYSEGKMLVVGIDLPARSGITKAPYLGMALELDAGIMREVMTQIDMKEAPLTEGGLGILVNQLGDPVADCLARLIRLFERPEAVPVLYPSLARELYYWLLTGPGADEIRRLVLTTGHTQRIAKAIHALKSNYDQPIRIQDLADTACMSASSFHQHFKALTSMTPLQFQKQLRLLEARRLMTCEAANVTHAAFKVGYESTSQFSREYTRHFGISPKQDAMAVREGLAQPSDAAAHAGGRAA